ncbi:Plug domain-containing protein [Thermomonas sp. S9]|nr:Plug domain-containing protein [Thermomonas sp. S9]
MPRQTLLALALLAALPLHAQQAPQTSAAQTTPPSSDTRHQEESKDKHVKDLAGVVVTASALQDTADTLSKPVEVLAGARLDENRAATLGETVSSVPGVQSSNFGPGVGRPIIRGMDGPRVAILSGGLSSQDVSTVSQDHAPAIEPFLADQIEVLKGPSTLLYGSGADRRRGERGRWPHPQWPGRQRLQRSRRDPLLRRRPGRQHHHGPHRWRQRPRRPACRRGVPPRPRLHHPGRPPVQLVH